MGTVCNSNRNLHYDDRIIHLDGEDNSYNIDCSQLGKKLNFINKIIG
jgi:hypothetical protein